MIALYACLAYTALSLIAGGVYIILSYPFTPPSTDHIAVKVINHYGDEALKAYKV